ncbi:hypothetical protein IV203_025270 [Nitzschia inconspicua]|uniref:Uncharacterized protein n=1 Tax=Nitzschia inconspicua TaxID=303405 RepID=A0A9K3LJZ4_9STRA|nr:hypothetical protein IV203_024725 [Nitzschia inconspicua]KAG7362386.1 hypothetical protein IV203_025270 [Nitzschia inconspicua]
MSANCIKICIAPSVPPQACSHVVPCFLAPATPNVGFLRVVCKTLCNCIDAWNLVILPFSTFTRLFSDINSQTWKPAQLFHRVSNIPRISSTTPLLPLCFSRRVQILSNIIDRIWSMQSNQLPVRAFSNMELADSDMFVVTRKGTISRVDVYKGRTTTKM